jgi:hypothetical protein
MSILLFFIRNRDMVQPGPGAASYLKNKSDFTDASGRTYTIARNTVETAAAGPKVGSTYVLAADAAVGTSSEVRSQPAPVMGEKSTTNSKSAIASGTIISDTNGAGSTNIEHASPGYENEQGEEQEEQEEQEEGEEEEDEYRYGDNGVGEVDGGGEGCNEKETEDREEDGENADDME